MRDFGAMRAFLFDLDGVLVFTDRHHCRAWRQLADEQGWAFDEAVNERCKGVPRMASLEVILRHNGIDLPQAEKEGLADRKNEAYVARLARIDRSDMVAGALPFLRTLREAGGRIGLCSASRNASLVVERLGMEALFDARITGHEVERPKPDPDIFLKGAAECGASPAEALVFEDALSGVQAARAAGCACVGVGDPDALPGADAHIRDFTDPALADLFPRLHLSEIR